MPEVKEIVEYESLDIYGKTNTGKTVMGYSLVELADYESEKDHAILFTNEAHWAKVLKKNFPDHEKYFKAPHGKVYFHKNLNEFESDIDQFFRDYDAVKENPRTAEKIYNLDKIAKLVNCIMIDDGAWIFREGYVKRFAKLKESKGEKILPKDWPIPRGEFISKVKEVVSLPSHFAICSKVGKEFTEVYKTSADGRSRWLTFEPTGDDKYRLPEDFEYENGTRIHLYGANITIPKEDSEEIVRRHFGQVIKSKETRIVIPPIPNPTVKKLIHYEKMTAQREKLEAQQATTQVA